MAYLTQKEFERAIHLLAEAQGLDRLRDKFFRLRGLVTRRGFKNPEALANQLFTLSSGMRREVPANIAFQAIWGEHLGTRLGEGAEEKFQKLADAVNSCLDAEDKVVADKRGELDAALAAYESALAEGVGSEVARLDMLMKAVPDIADILRSTPLATAAAPAAAGEAETADPS
jgi:hypothetical protein